MLRPWWLGMLAFALLVAAVFAWLGQWQLGRAIDTDPPPPGATEQVRPIADVTAPGEYLPEPLVGQRVSVAGYWVAGDFLVVSSRFNGGEEGYWVTGQLRVAEGEGGERIEPPTSIAVALGWTRTRADADAAVAEWEASLTAIDYGAVELTGRLISDEGPVLPPRGGPATDMTRMSPAALLGRWHDVDGLNVYRPYLVADRDTLGPVDAPASVLAIDSPAPEEGSNVNWLNIFYAVEWAIFAGFAFYMWYRLTKDAWEKELEALEELETAPAEA
ncbi:MAG: hypothetical protein DI566_02010 [Microbacterium sp.]|nr:MAG: hypothetical protein DI566_02010 [Microbacterium sp.]